MDQFTKNLTDGLRRFAMAGVGAISLTVEKSREIFDQLATRGEATAADKQVACDELQQKMTEQLNAFTQKLKADYENASFEQLIQKCIRLTPDQKALLIERLTAESQDEDIPAGNDACSDPAGEELQNEVQEETPYQEKLSEDIADEADKAETPSVCFADSSLKEGDSSGGLSWQHSSAGDSPAPEESEAAPTD